MTKSPGELHKFVVSICQAKRIDHSILTDVKMQQLQAEVEATKNIGQNLHAKAKARLEIFSKKRIAAIQVVKEAMDQKQVVQEMLGQPALASMPGRKSLMYKQNAGILTAGDRNGSSTNVFET